MENLPGDIVIDILSRLPVKSLGRCRCVCKSWLNSTLGPRFTDMHLNRALQQKKNPSLVLNNTAINCNHADEFFSSQIFLVENDKTGNYTSLKLNGPSPPSFQKFRLMGSCNGLLCLYDAMFKFNVYVCNPCIGDYIKLPELKSSLPGPHVVFGGFEFDPNSNQYKVVEIFYYYGVPVRSEVHVYSPGNISWRLLGEAPYLIRGDTPYLEYRQVASKAFVNGALHWVGCRTARTIVSFDLADEVFDVFPLPEFVLRGGDYTLAVLRGHLSLMDSSFEDRAEMWVMNDFGVRESWTKYFTINSSQVEWNIRCVQILCFQQNGEDLLLYNSHGLFSYSTRTMTLSMLSISGLPCCFEGVTYVGTLISPSGLLRIHPKGLGKV